MRHTVGPEAPALKDPDKGLLPDVVDVREISVNIATAVIKTSIDEGLAQEKGIPEEVEDLEEWVRAQMWEPKYRELVKPEGGKVYGLSAGSKAVT